MAVFFLSEKINSITATLIVYKANTNTNTNTILIQKIILCYWVIVEFASTCTAS